ncbi:cadherin-1-like [Haliotis cracherodii]|uniref:cadherin-1-like n=1 Tax=Haliotis cracherodii TaxID=6455 RepID=UPI0039EB2AA6
MKLLWSVLLLYVFFVSKTLGVPPVIGGTPIVCNIDEGTQVETKLVCINCTSDLNVAVSGISISPSSPCGTCFNIYQVNPDEGYCVYYLASQGTLSYRRAPSYNMEVECTDGAGEASTAVVEIRVRTNEAPTFTLTTDQCKQNPFPTNTVAGEVIFDGGSAVDPNNDTLYYSMSTTPVTDNFEIGISDGIIRAKNPLVFECNPSVTFSIKVQDEKNPAVGPLTVTCAFTASVAPTISNANKDIDVVENTTGDIITLTASPTTPAVTFDYSTNPEEALSMFSFTDGTIKVAYPLDYENVNLKSINITVLPENGYCNPILHYIHVVVTDDNDGPSLTPKQLSKELYEGFITFSPGFTVVDEDAVDTHYYSIISGNNRNYFTIDQSTGVISSTIEYDIDTGAPGSMKDTVNLTIQVNDTKGHAVDTADLYITIKDINDNAPVFTETSLTVDVTECDRIGTLLATLVAEDTFDSDYNNNNVVYIEATSNGNVAATEDGSVYLKSAIAAGQTSILTVNAKDRGTYPIQQTSVIPATVTVRSTACVVTTVNTVIVNAGGGVGTGTGTNTNTGNGGTGNAATSTSTTTTTTTSPLVDVNLGTCDGFFCDTANVMALIFGGLGAIGLLAGLAYCLSKYCKNKTSPEAKEKAKDKAEEKARKKAEKKAKKQKKSSPDAFDFWSSGVV